MKHLANQYDLKCLALIGSHARGDDNLFSDVDLLGIIDGPEHSMINVKKVNLSIYSESYLRSMMRDGELFSLHIVTEGLAITNEVFFRNICNEFKYKDSYCKDKAIAYLMGDMILQERLNISNWAVANKRISWCVRTYIFALMAEMRRPYFSKESIAFFGANAHPSISYQDFVSLVNAKQHQGYSELLVSILERFIGEIISCKPTDRDIKKLYISESILNNTLKQMSLGFY